MYVCIRFSVTVRKRLGLFCKARGDVIIGVVDVKGHHRGRDVGE